MEGRDEQPLDQFQFFSELTPELKREIILKISGISELKNLRLVSKATREVVDELLTSAKSVITILNILPPQNARLFVKTYPDLFEKEVQDGTATDLQIVVNALTASSMKTDPAYIKKLDEAFNAVKSDLDKLEINLNAYLEILYAIKSWPDGKGDPQQKRELILEIIAKLNFDSSITNNLQHLDLSGVQLTLGYPTIDLSNIQLYGVNISQAKFAGIKMLNANLSFADAHETDFSHSTLAGTNFQGANLMGANFTKAILMNIDFSGANLNDANFQGAILQNVIFFSSEDLSSELALKSALQPFHIQIKDYAMYKTFVLAIVQDLTSQIKHVATTDAELAKNLIAMAVDVMTAMVGSAQSAQPLTQSFVKDSPAIKELIECQKEIDAILSEQQKVKKDTSPT